MAVSKKLLKHLEAKGVKFDVVEHKKVYTAYDLAQTLGEKLEKIGKSLLVQVELPALKKKGKKHFVVVVPASYQVDLKKIEKALKAKKAELAPEKVLKKLGIKPGALVPFGSFHKLEVLLDKTLLNAKDIILSAGSFTDSLRMKTKDLHKIEDALVAAIGIKVTKGKPKKKKVAPKKKTAKKKLSPKKKAVPKRKKAVPKRKKR